MPMKYFKLFFFLPGIMLITALLSPTAHSQVIEGVDYSGRSGVYQTFDMAREDVFGKRFPSEHLRYIDEVTGVEVIALTTSRRSSSKMYQTHPQWTPDGKYIVFTSRFSEQEGTGLCGFHGELRDCPDQFRERGEYLSPGLEEKFRIYIQGQRVD
jgi:hypothetical protein